MQTILFERKTTPRARTGFAVLTHDDKQLLIEALTFMASQVMDWASDPKSTTWEVFSARDKSVWGSSREGNPNCAISVLGGSIGKLLTGGDLTDRQVLWVNRLFEIAEHLEICERINLRKDPNLLY